MYSLFAAISMAASPTQKATEHPITAAVLGTAVKDMQSISEEQHINAKCCLP